MTDENDMAPVIEYRAVDHVKTIKCPNCGNIVEQPRTEPWISDGSALYARSGWR